MCCSLVPFLAFIVPAPLLFVMWIACVDVNCLRSFRMNRRKADFKFAYKFLEDEV